MTASVRDYSSLLKQVVTPRLRFKNNVHLVIRAVEAEYDFHTIGELLKISPQTEALASQPQLQQQNHEDCLAFTRSIAGNYTNGEDYRLRLFSCVEDTIGLAKVFFCLYTSGTYRESQKATFDLVLKQHGLKAHYYTARRILVIHDPNDINREFFCAHHHKVENYGNGWLVHIISDNLACDLKLKLWQDYRSLKREWSDDFYLRLVLRAEARYSSEKCQAAKIAELNGIVPNNEANIVREDFVVVNPNWQLHLQQMKNLGIDPDYWLTVCVRENESRTVERAIAVYQQKTHKRNFVRSPISYWRYILNNLDCLTLYDGYANDCPAGTWIGTVDRLMWGKKANILVFLTLESGEKYYFAEYHNNNYTPKLGTVNLARGVKVGQKLEIETELTPSPA